jgi:hypothetical protein
MAKNTHRFMPSLDLTMPSKNGSVANLVENDEAAGHEQE